MALIAAVILLALQSTAFQSPRWKEGSVVRVWTDTRLAPEGASTLVERAMKTWTDAAGGRLTLTRTPSRAEAAVRVLFVASDSV